MSFFRWLSHRFYHKILLPGCLLGSFSFRTLFPLLSSSCLYFSQLLIHQPLWHMDLNALHHILCWTQVFQFRFFQFCFLIGSFSCNFYFHPLIWLFYHLPYVYLDQTRNSVLGEDGNPCWLLGPWLFLAMFFWLSNASWPKVCTCSSKFLSSNSLFDLL